MKIVNLASALAAAACLVATAPALAAEWIMATTSNDSSYQTRNARAFAEDVDRMSGGKLKIKMYTNSTLYKTPEVKRAVSTGQAQLGQLFLGAHANEHPILEAEGIFALTPNFDAAKKLWTLEKPILNAFYARQNVEILSATPFPTQGFLSKGPLTTRAQMKGKKWRAAGPASAEFGENLGMVPVTGITYPGEIAQAFVTGQINMFYSSAQGGAETQAWEYADRLILVGGPHTKLWIIVNKAALAGLDAPTRDAVVKAAALADERGFELAKQTEVEYSAELKKRGMAVEQASDEVRAAVNEAGEASLKKWLTKAGPEGADLVKQLRSK
jgi:TRAP-type C4-dicarboxylate transport system substrate-binding protein